MADEQPRWVKIAPGPGAEYWDDCLANGYIRVGWEAVGDLRAYDSRDEYVNAFRKHYPDQQPGQLWTLRQLKAGDRVVANRGMSHILAVGEVVDPGYVWLDDLPVYNHAVMVNWDTSLAREIEEVGGWRRTVLDLTPEFVEQVVSDETSGAPSEAWLFQANPAYYDIDAAVAARGAQSWQVKRYADRIKPGDEVYLWRTDPQAGFVGVGTIVEATRDMTTPPEEERFIRDADKFAGSFPRAMVQVTTHVDPPLLKTEIENDPTLRDLPNLRFRQSSNYRLTSAHVARLRELVDERLQGGWHLRPGESIRRIDLHGLYGGSGQSGISPSARTPNILLFTDASAGAPHGYIYDGWDEQAGLFFYTGEGQQGDQTLTSGNLAIAGHRSQGRKLRLFEGARGQVRYIGEFEVAEPAYEEKDAPSTGAGAPRKVLVFRLRPVGDFYRPGDPPPEFDFELFDRAVAELQADRLEHADLHAVAQEQLATWISDRGSMTDDDLWAGLRDRFLRFGNVEMDGRVYGQNDPVPTPQELADARARGAVAAHGNLHWTNLHRSVKVDRDDLPDVRRAIEVLLDDSMPYEERIARLVEGTDSVPGFGLAHWTGLYAMATGWDKAAVNGTVAEAFDRLRWPLKQRSPAGRATEVDDRSRRLLERSGLESLADIDWVYWRVTQEAAEVSPKHDPDVVDVPASATAPSLDWLLQQTLWPRSELELVLETIQEKTPQIILAGPPGTGKTWVAKALARYLTEGREGGVKMVQFHPSYSYEQFVEGLRPVVHEGAIEFRRVDGVVLQLTGEMVDGKRRVLVIDEMNRANLPRVLGELMYLFEYREENISLQYSPSFQLPAELLFIGTMNTADRSIRSIDIALRRRFDIFECMPDRLILERYYAPEGYTNDVADLFDGFDALNQALTNELDRHHTIGQTFFMAPVMTPDYLHHVWRHKLGPLIEEYFFDRPDLATSFTVETFWPSLT